MHGTCSWMIAGCLIATVPIASEVVLANPANQKVAEIARKTTVRIENSSNTLASGSGFIINKQGNTYTVLTANHVVADAKVPYKIYTHDGKVHPVNNVQNLDNAPNFYDIALVTFSSDTNYERADLGDSDSAQEGEPVFVSGFPFVNNQNRQEYQLNSGLVTSRVANREKGYTMRYNASTAGGMSGGAVFNSQGQVIGIHGQGDVDRDVSIESRAGSAPALKVGINAAIPIKLFAQVSSTEIKLQETLRVANRPVTIDLLFARGQTKLADGDYAGAIADFNESIRQKPNNPEAYNARATAKFRLGDTRGAISDLDTAISQRPNYAVAFGNRGAIKREMKDLAGALNDYNQALKISPRNAGIFNNRALVYFDQGNLQSAINDLNQAIAIQPRNGDIFFNRAFLK